MIIGQSVQLRAIEEHDLPALQAWLNDPEIASQVGGFTFPVSLADQKRWFDRQHGNANTQRWIVQTHDGERLGLSGLWAIDRHNRSAMSAIKLGATDVRGKGYGTDVILTVSAYAFYTLGLHRLWAEILPFNQASYRLYVDKCGWKVEGVYRESVFRSGRFYDQVRVSTLERDFRALPAAAPYLPDAPEPSVVIAPEHRTWPEPEGEG